MNDLPTDIAEEVVTDRTGREMERAESDPLSAVDGWDFDELPEETDEEIAAGRAESEEDDRAARYGVVSNAELARAERVAKLRRSMADFEAGRYRPAKDVLREIAAEDGITLPE